MCAVVSDSEVRKLVWLWKLICVTLIYVMSMNTEKSNPHEWVLSSVILRPDDINSWLLDVQLFDNIIGSMTKGEESMKGSYCCVM